MHTHLQKTASLLCFFFILNVHPLLACSSLKLLSPSTRATAFTIDDICNNICVACRENCANAVSDCGHLILCSVCSSKHVNASKRGRTRCPCCRAPVTFYRDINLLECCSDCKINIPSIGHSLCHELVLCHACKGVRIKKCPSCGSSKGNLYELFLSGNAAYLDPPDSTAENEYSF